MPSRSRKFSSATASSSRQPSPGGFTLLEVLVALAILGLGLGVIFPGIALSLKFRRDAADSARLAIATEQVLGDLALRKKAPEAAEEGEIGGCRWQVEPLEAAGAEPAPGTTRRGAELVTLRVTVEVPGGPRWEMSTLLPRGKAEVSR